jgi:hypothetical protein
MAKFTIFTYLGILITIECGCFVFVYTNAEQRTGRGGPTQATDLTEGMGPGIPSSGHFFGVRAFSGKIISSTKRQQ